MRVPDDLRDCTCFIEAWRDEATTSLGTAFFVGVGVGYADRMVVYAVTAKHCLYDGDGVPESVALVLNTQAGAIDRIQTSPSDWVEHPKADVAILSLLPEVGRYRYRAYPSDKVADPAFRVIRKVGAGDEVFMTGLLVHQPAETQVLPIARLGSIAALPTEPVRLRYGRHPGAQVSADVVALLEVRSIGGLSGSPVYLHLPFWRDVAEGTMFVGTGDEAGSGGENYLLGLVHGMYPVGRNDPDGVSGGDEAMNTGIAVVVLVERIIELLDAPEQVLRREAIRQLLVANEGRATT